MANAKGLSLRGGQRPTWRPEREARGSALGVQSRSSRLHRGKVTGEIATAFPRLPRRFAPRNDTSGGYCGAPAPSSGLIPLCKALNERRYRRNRSVRFYRHLVRTGSAFPRLPRRFAPRNDTSGRRSNGNGAAHRIGGTTAASRTGGACPSRRRTGVRDRLSLKWQTPKVCHCKEAKGRRGNLAVPGCIVGKLPAKSQLPSRDCHVASLLAMTRQGSAAMGTVRHTESAVLLPLRGRAGHAPPLQGQCGFNGGRCESAMPSRDRHGPFGASQ